MAEAVPRFERKTGFHVQATVNKAVAGGGSTVLGFETVQFDSGNNFDIATDRYTVPLNGVYHFHASVLCQFTSANTSRNILQLETSAAVEQYRGSDMSYTTHALNFVFTQWLDVVAFLTQGTVLQMRSISIAGAGYTLIAGNYFRWSGYRLQSESRTILGG